MEEPIKEIVTKQVPINDKFFRNLADRLHTNEWERLATDLGFTNAQISKIKDDHQGHSEDQIFNMFVRWKERQTEQKDHAKTALRLVGALNRVGRRDIAADVRKIFILDEHIDSLQETEDGVKEVTSGVRLMAIPPVAFNNLLFKVTQKLSIEDVTHMKYLIEGTSETVQPSFDHISDAAGFFRCLRVNHLLGPDNTWFFQYLLYLIRNQAAYTIVLEYNAERMKNSPVLCISEPPKNFSENTVTLRIQGDINNFQKITLEKFRQLLADKCNGQLVYIHHIGTAEGSIMIHFEVTNAIRQSLLADAYSKADWLIDNDVMEVRIWDGDNIQCIMLNASKKALRNQADNNFAVLSALLSGDTEAVMSELDQGGDVNSVCGGKSLLMWAAELDDCRMVDILLNLCANPNVTSDDGATALHKAAFLGLDRVCKRLLQCQDTIANLLDKLGNTPLLLAANQDILAFTDCDTKRYQGESDINDDSKTAISRRKASDFRTAKVLLENRDIAQITTQNKETSYVDSDQNQDTSCLDGDNNKDTTSSDESTLDDETRVCPATQPSKQDHRRLSSVQKVTKKLHEGLKSIERLGPFVKILSLMARKSPGSIPCKKPWCTTCQYVIPTTTVCSTANSKAFSIQQHVSCSTRNLIYLLQCKKCNKQFVGDTVDVFRSEITHLIKSIETTTEISSSCVVRHFGQADHNVLDVEVIGLECMDDKSDEIRCARADEWIRELQSMEPYGLNQQLCSPVPLPCTYEYHSFIYHCDCERDLEVSIDILNKLEQRGLRCFMWSRDTIPGNSVVDAILQAIQSSHKVVMVLSSNFLKDGMCRFAVMAIMEMMKKRSDGDGFVVSVVVDKCALPDDELRLSRSIDLTVSDEGSMNSGLQRLVELVMQVSV